MKAAVDFKALVPVSWAHQGTTIHLGRGVKLDGDAAFYTAQIVRRRFNPQGRELKGEHVLTLCGEPGAPLGQLLRDLAGLFEQEAPVEMSSR